MRRESVSAASVGSSPLLQALHALERGDFTPRVPEEGAEAEAARTLNRIMARQAALQAELQRLAREIGIEGRFGGQAECEGIEGEWAATMHLANEMAANLTNQVRAVSHALTMLAMGRVRQPSLPEAAGETAELFSVLRTLVSTMEGASREAGNGVRRRAVQAGLTDLREWRRNDAPIRKTAPKVSLAWSLNQLGNDALEQGDLDTARQLLEEGAVIARELEEEEGNPYWVPAYLESLSMLATREGRPQIAARLLGAAQAARAASRRPGSLTREDLDARTEALRSALGSSLESELEAGRALPPRKALEIAVGS
jgi:hypothetical protein